MAGDNPPEFIATQTNKPVKSYWFNSYADFTNGGYGFDPNLDVGTICYIKDSGIYVIREVTVTTNGQNRTEKQAVPVGQTIRFVDMENQLPSNDDAMQAQYDQKQLMYVRATNKLYAYDAGFYAWIPINPTPYLGNGNTTAGDQEDGADINATPESASPTHVVTEKQVSQFVADQIALISSGIGSVHHAPVADIAALKALVSTDQTDKEIILVEAENSIWRWDAEATTAPTASGASPITVVLPTDLEEDYDEDPATPGRWIKLLNGASLILTSTTPAAIGFEDPNNDNVYTAKAATSGVSTEVARADHVHELVGVARVDQISWIEVVATASMG